jgi:hypothetical protein
LVETKEKTKTKQLVETKRKKNKTKDLGSKDQRPQSPGASDQWQLRNLRTSAAPSCTLTFPDICGILLSNWRTIRLSPSRSLEAGASDYAKL